ncbi:hypothetical protein AHAS_Ahas06G0192100 [Arachis hypogaea]
MVFGKCVLGLVDPFSFLALMVNITILFAYTLISVIQPQWLCLGNVPMHVTSMEIVLRDDAIAFLDFKVIIAVNIPSPATAMAMAFVSQMEFVNVKLVTLARMMNVYLIWLVISLVGP